MNCERFKTRLLDFALGVEDVDLRAHLDACPTCRAELDAQRALLEKIDRGVAGLVAGEPSGDFAAQVRRIAEQAAAPHKWLSGWLPLATASALALVALLIVWNFGRPPRLPQTAREAVPALVAPAGKPREIAPPDTVRTAASTAVVIGSRPPRLPQSAANREPEILVPRGEMAAVMRLYEANWNGKADGASLIAKLPPLEDSLKPMAFEELRIPALQLGASDDGEKPRGP